MTPMIPFLIGLGVATASATGVVTVLARPFHAVVMDLCGTAARARFWTAYVSVLFLMAPILAVSWANISARGAGLDLVGSVFFSVLALFIALLVFGFNVWRPSVRLFEDARRIPTGAAAE